MSEGHTAVKPKLYRGYVKLQRPVARQPIAELPVKIKAKKKKVTRRCRRCNGAQNGKHHRMMCTEKAG